MTVVLSPPLAPPIPAPSRGWSILHKAVDWPVRTGTPVLAPASGKVTATEFQLAGGLMVHIDHGEGVETNYAHLLSRSVSKGEMVRAGQQIALSGASGIVTGAHLHFGVRVNGVWIDPLAYLAGSATAPAPAGQPDAYPRDIGESCAPGYRPGTVDPRAHWLVPGTDWFARPRNPDGTVNACIREGVREGAAVDGLRVEIDWPSVIEPALNIGVIVAAAVLAWNGLQRILRA